MKLSVGYHTVRNIFASQCLAIVSSMTLGILGVIVSYTSNDLVCHVLFVLGSLLYGLVNMSLYIFLLLRGRLVSFARPKAFKYVEYFLVIVILAFVITALPLLIIKSAGLVVPVTDSDSGAEACAFHVSSLVSETLICFDSVLSFGCLLLFIYPLFHVKNCV